MLSETLIGLDWIAWPEPVGVVDGMRGRIVDCWWLGSRGVPAIGHAAAIRTGWPPRNDVHANRSRAVGSQHDAGTTCLTPRVQAFVGQHQCPRLVIGGRRHSWLRSSCPHARRVVATGTGVDCCQSQSHAPTRFLTATQVRCA